MNPFSRFLIRSVGVVVLVGLLGACSSSGGSVSTAAGGRQWTAANEKLPGYERAGVADAKAVIDRIVAAGVACEEYTPYPFATVVNAYNAGNMPMARGAGTCYGRPDPADTAKDPEEVLVEIYGTRPSAKDFVRAKARYICKRAEKLAKGATGPLAFSGIPFVMAKDATWIIEPDTDAMAQRIGTALGRPAQNMCDFD